MRDRLKVSERRACEVLNQPRSSQRYAAKKVSSDEKRLAPRIHELVRRHPRYGYRRMWALLRREGWRVNRKRIYRLWRKEGLKVPQKQREKRHVGHSGNSCVRRRAEYNGMVFAERTQKMQGLILVVCKCSLQRRGQFMHGKCTESWRNWRLQANMSDVIMT